MILYKYYGFNAGTVALKSSRLGFRTPAHFNDPFELTFYSHASGPDSKLSRLESNIEELKQSVVILSLTRTPLNSLMWAHYGEEHTGFVIGYDVSNDFLTSRDYNLIPVDAGDVVYTNTKNLHLLDLESMERFHRLYLAGQGLLLGEQERNEIENLIRRTFLTKHGSWAYEDEVRVVKILQSIFELCEDYQSDAYRGFDTLPRMVAPGCCCSLVEGLYIYREPVKIKEVYLGVRNPLISNATHGERPMTIDSSLSVKANDENWAVFKLVMDTCSWGLKVEPVTRSSLNIREKDKGLLSSFSFTGKEAEFLSRKLRGFSLSGADSLELTNWNGQYYLKKNGQFVGT